MTTDLLATWRHYLAIGLYLILIIVSAKSLKYSRIGLEIYLILATFALHAITPDITTSWIRIGPISTPPVQLLSLGILTLYAIINLNSLIDMYLDYEDVKIARKTRAAGHTAEVKESEEN